MFDIELSHMGINNENLDLVCKNILSIILSMTLLRNYTYFDAINVKHILMTLPIKCTLCTHINAYFNSDVAKNQRLF